MRLAAAVLGVVMIGLIPAPATAGVSDVDDPVGSDYNGDGIDDLAVGSASNSVRGYFQTGTVSVLYGSPDGLTAVDDDLWWAGSAGLLDEPYEYSSFGGAIASADFDGDGYDDLAAGAVGDRVDDVAMGSVRVLRGSPDGLTDRGDQRWTPRSEGLGADPAVREVGASLGVGDLDGNGYGDLVVVANGQWDVRSVHVLYGSEDGLAAVGSESFHRPWEQCGGPDDDVAVGDLDGDGSDDLVWGQPCDDEGTGRAEVWFGSSDGLADEPDVVLAQEAAQLPGEPAAGERFAIEVETLDASARPSRFATSTAMVRWTS